jgi:hypothetical protein
MNALFSKNNDKTDMYYHLFLKILSGEVKVELPICNYKISQYKYIHNFLVAVSHELYIEYINKYWCNSSSDGTKSQHIQENHAPLATFMNLGVPDPYNFKNVARNKQRDVHFNNYLSIYLTIFSITKQQNIICIQKKNDKIHLEYDKTDTQKYKYIVYHKNSGISQLSSDYILYTQRKNSDYNIFLKKYEQFH